MKQYVGFGPDITRFTPQYAILFALVMVIVAFLLGYLVVYKRGGDDFWRQSEIRQIAGACCGAVVTFYAIVNTGAYVAVVLDSVLGGIVGFIIGGMLLSTIYWWMIECGCRARYRKISKS